MTVSTVDELTPTAEQERALDLFATGGPLVIQALAGTGKTSTLELLARSTPRTGTYVAFNKAIATEAQHRFPMTIRSSTMHSLAYRALADRLRVPERLREARRIPSSKIARDLGIGPVMLTVAEPTVRTKVMQPGFLAGHVMRAVERFCQSADTTPGPEHFPYIEGIDAHDLDGRRGRRNNRLLAYELLGALERAWADVSSPNGRLRYSHSHYLKSWALTGPELYGDFLLVDEAQDFNGVMLSVADANRHKQVITVGDSFQQLYEWRGSIDALNAFDGERTFLSQSFRFGPKIADVGNALLAALGSEVQMSGTESIESTVGAVATPRAVLCRTNAASVDVMLNEQRRGRTVHLVGGGREIVDFAVSAGKLQAGQRATHPDLVCFDSWREVVEFVDQDPLGDELRMLVRLVEEYGVQIILDALDGMVAEEAADVIVSTGHKAKGREWPTVRLAADFDQQSRGDGKAEMSPAEYRLLYVACTRARERLDVTGCPPVRDLLPAEGA